MIADRNRKRMEGGSARERIKQVWEWRTSRTLLIIAVVITIIISLFEFTTDMVRWLREIVSNFITSASITFLAYTLTAAFGIVHLGKDWKRFFLLIVLLAVGGMLGGLLGWGINDLLFPYRITHPHFYLMMVAVLAIIFGLSIIAYQNIYFKLEETAAKLAEKEVEEQKLLGLKAKAELEALRAKINPHFLFNTLNSIASLIPTDSLKAEEMVQKLSNLFHYILAASSRDMVALDEELDFVEEYLEIEKARLGDRLEYAVERAAPSEDIVIPGMLLQPLVENSVKYGIIPEKKGGRIDIRCNREGDYCTIEIIDSGKGFVAESIDEGFGLSSVRQRLELHFADNHEFHISAEDGLSIIIRIPVGGPPRHGEADENGI